MKRWLVRICVFLILGAIVNVAVAWGCALFMPLRFTTPGRMDEATVRSEGDRWIIDRLQHPTGELVFSFKIGEDIIVHPSQTVEDLVPAYAIDYFGITETSKARVRACGTKAHGWPCLALWCGFAFHSARNTLNTAPTTFAITLGTADSPVIDAPRLPLCPIWPGFAINTVFYAAVLGALFLGPGMVRRAVRRRRGLCPACGYPVGVSTTCTECGAAVRINSA